MSFIDYLFVWLLSFGAPPQDLERSATLERPGTVMVHKVPDRISNGF